MGVFAQRYANQFLREENAFTERVNAITFFLMSINFTLIILKITQSVELLSVGLILVYVSGFFLFKIGLIKLLGFILKTKDLSKLAVFFSMLFDRTLGFILFPLVVLLYFFSFEVSTIFLAISFVLFLILVLSTIYTDLFSAEAGMPQLDPKYWASQAFWLILVFSVLASKSQKVYSVEYDSQADIKVFVVDYESQADLSVFKVEYSSQAGKNDGKWFFVEYASQADKKIFFTAYASQADVLIYFVEYSSQAKWRKKEKLHLFY